MTSMRSLHGRTLRCLQKDALQFMTWTCVVSRIDGWTTDDDDVQVPNEVTVYEGVCKVQSWNPETREAVSVGSTKVIQRYLCDFPVGTDVRHGDIVRISGYPRSLYLRGAHLITHQTAVRMQADDEANSSA